VTAVRQPNLLAPSPSGRHPSADTRDWTDTWVCVGVAEQLTEPGAVLPATIGYHAVHVRRTGAGLVAAVNARPFGGCASIPAHCGSTRNVKCPHLACAFSADEGVLDGANDPDGAARAEFVGDGRRTVTLPLAQWSSLLFTNVTLAPAIPHPLAGVPAPRAASTIGSAVLQGNWLATPLRVASVAVDTLGGDVIPVAPNLMLIQHGLDGTLAVFSKPAGQNHSTVVWTNLGPAPAIDMARVVRAGGPVT
jgi:nitrite reductase/ring-hydroxylating ferredoxin subunit